MTENVPLVDADSRLNSSPAAKKAKQMSKRFLVKKLSEHAFLPKRGSAGAAGYDLARSAEPRIWPTLRAVTSVLTAVRPADKELHDTQFQCSEAVLPPYTTLAPFSSLIPASRT